MSRDQPVFGTPPPPGTPRTPPPRDDSHVPFLLAALAYGVLGGFTLAVALPIEAALGRVDVGWLAHAQVHGHLQVIGFAGLFVLGVSTRLAPRFGNGQLARVPMIAAFALLAGGMLARTLGQPVAQHPPFAVLLAVGAALEAGGGLVALVVLARALRPWAADASPSSVLLTMSVVWLAMQALLGAWWLLDLAREGQRVLPAAQNAVLLELQIFGFLLSALVAVGSRSFPTFFGVALPPGPRLWLIAATLQVGIALWTGGLWLRAAEESDLARLLAGLGQLAVGAAAVAIAAAVGWWRRHGRLAPASRHFMWSLRAVLAWLTLTGLLLAGSAAAAMLRGDFVGSDQLDAIRHVFLLGVVSLAIVIMGQLILPEFASERLVRQPGTWRGVAFGAALSVAALLRGVLPLAGVTGETQYWLMSVGGLAALGAVGTFAYLYLGARRSHRAYLARMAAWRAGELPMR